MSNFKNIVVTVLMSIALWHSNSNASVQGQLGTNSSADIDLTVTVGLLSRITGLTDVNFGTWSSGVLQTNNNFCVGMFGTNQYTIRAKGQGTGSNPNAFAISNGTSSIPYKVFLNDETGVAGNVEVFADVNLVSQSTGGFASFFNAIVGCAIPNANVDILIEENELSNAQAGNYTGVLTLVLIPE